MRHNEALADIDAEIKLLKGGYIEYAGAHVWCGDIHQKQVMTKTQVDNESVVGLSVEAAARNCSWGVTQKLKGMK